MIEEYLIKTDPRKPDMYRAEVTWRNKKIELGSFENFDKAFKACKESKSLFEDLTNANRVQQEDRREDKYEVFVAPG